MYKIRGKIIDKNIETIQGKKGDTFEKMYITIEETDTGFHHKHQFEIFGKEKIELQKDNVKSNEWKGKFFNTLNIKGIRAEDALEQPDTQSVPF